MAIRTSLISLLSVVAGKFFSRRSRVVSASFRFFCARHARALSSIARSTQGPVL
jgi:hypothetical protein